MRINKKYCFMLFFIATAMFLLNACNFGVSKPDSNLPPTLSSETPLIPTGTAALVSLPTSTLTSTPPFTPPSILTPSPTTTLFFAPTVTSTPQWSVCPGIVITVTDTDNGDILHVLRCEDGLKYDLGPLAKGAYAVGPNDKFFVYVTISGSIYAARIGDLYLNKLFNLVTEREFTVFNKKVKPDFKISFVGEASNYRLVLLEKNYDQKRVYELPSRITY